LGKQFSEENSWNQWKKTSQIYKAGHATKTPK
jgi:hypothetical protein